jgi:hypothetical protein
MLDVRSSPLSCEDDPVHIGVQQQQYTVRVTDMVMSMNIERHQVQKISRGS